MATQTQSLIRDKQGRTLAVSAKALRFLDRAGVLQSDDSPADSQLVAAEKPYYGWPNHATWCVNLHIGNQETTYNHARNLAALCKRESVTHPNVASGVWTVAETQRITLAERLKEWIGANCGIDDGERAGLDRSRTHKGVWPLLMEDLITSYLQDVDWQRLAEAYLED